jgi:ABC-type transport system involved in cytochrome bd biosynthesis fused ATPase/permease subunit
MMNEILNFFSWWEWAVILVAWSCIPLAMWIAHKQKKREKEFRQEIERKLDGFTKGEIK